MTLGGGNASCAGTVICSEGMVPFMCQQWFFFGFFGCDFFVVFNFFDFWFCVIYFVVIISYYFCDAIIDFHVILFFLTFLFYLLSWLLFSFYFLVAVGIILKLENQPWKNPRKNIWRLESHESTFSLRAIIFIVIKFNTLGLLHN